MEAGQQVGTSDTDEAAKLNSSLSSARHAYDVQRPINAITAKSSRPPLIHRLRAELRRMLPRPVIRFDDGFES